MDDVHLKQPVDTSLKLSMLAQEWTHVSDSVEWNMNIYERYRVGLFALASAAGGVGFLQVSDDPSATGLSLGLWIVLPLVSVVVLYRMLSQLHFVNVKNARLMQIEATVEKTSGDRECFRMNHMLKADGKRLLTNPYPVTMAVMLALSILGVLYAEQQAFVGLSAMATQYFGLPLELIYRGFVWGFLGLFFIQFVLVLFESGDKHLGRKLH